MRLATLALLALAVTGCPHHETASREDEAVRVARATFERLAAGDPEAAELIDFAALRGGSLDAGARYRAISDDASRAAFRLAFVKSLGESLRAANVRALAWALEKRDGPVGVATAVIGGGRLHVSVLHGRVISIVRDPAERR